MSSAATRIPKTSDISKLLDLVRTYAGSVATQASTVAPAAAVGAVPGATGGDTLAIIQTILASVTSFVGMFFPGAEIAGLGITKILALVSGLASQVPEVVAAVQSLEAAISGGVAPTAEQWAALDAAADLAHENLQAAAAAFLAKQPPAPVPPASVAAKPAPAASVAGKKPS